MRLLFCASPGSATLNIIYFSGSARSRKWHRSHPKASGVAFSACAAAAEEWLSLLVWMALVIDWCKMLVRFSLSLCGPTERLHLGAERKLKLAPSWKEASHNQLSLRNDEVISSTLVLQIRPLLHNAINLSARAGERRTKEIVPFYDFLSSIEMNCVPRIVIVWRDIFAISAILALFIWLEYVVSQDMLS